MAEIVDGEDRISQLPIHIIHDHILPRICHTTKEDARTCVLSKTWNSIWRSRPNLIIAQSHHKSLIKSLGVEIFVKYVDDTLRPYVEQNLSIERFSLVKLKHPELSFHVDRWLSLLIKLNVRSLYINTKCFKYSIPDAIYAAKTLTVLWLGGCNFEIDNSTTTNKLQQLISTCPLISDLRVCYCKGVKNLHVSGLVNLEILVVCSCKGLEKLEISAPNLRMLEYRGANLKHNTRYEVEPLPCMVDILDGYNTLQILILEATTMTDQQFKYQLSKLSALEELALKSCGQLKNIKIVSEKLKRFSFWQCTHLEQVSLQQTPNLMEFEFLGCKMPFSTMDVSNLEQAKLYFLSPPDSTSYFGDVDAIWYNNLQSFVRKFNYSKDLILVIYCEEDESCLIYEDPREILVPPTRELALSIFKNPSMHLESFVDQLIKSWHLETISIVPRTDSKLVQVFDETIGTFKEKQYRRLHEVINHEGATDQDGGMSHLYPWLKSTSLSELITTFMLMEEEEPITKKEEEEPPFRTHQTLRPFERSC